MKILVWTGVKVGDGSFHYRINAPLSEARFQGLVEWSFSEHLDERLIEGIDVLVVQRLLTPHHIEAIEMIRENWPRITIVSEYDDDMLSTRPDNPAFHQGQEDPAAAYAYYQQEVVPALRRGLDVVDRITVSTPTLQARLQAETSTPVDCLPNTVDPVLFDVPAPRRGEGEQLRVGWAGSATHDIDWRNAATGVRKGLARGRAHLTLMGADYRFMLGVKDASFVGWAHAMDEYYLQLTTWHVALAPLADDRFNRAKSPVKALEAGALGLPIVASHAGPYPDLVIDGETGFLCRSSADWERALRTLAFDEDARVAMGERAREHVRFFNTVDWAPRWVESYRKAMAANLAAV